MPSGLFHGLVAAVIMLAVLKSALPERITGARGVDSRYNWLLDGVELAACLLMLVLCATLPVLTEFAGFWPLGCGVQPSRRSPCGSPEEIPATVGNGRVDGRRPAIGCADKHQAIPVAVRGSLQDRQHHGCSLRHQHRAGPGLEQLLPAPDRQFIDRARTARIGSRHARGKQGQFNKRGVGLNDWNGEAFGSCGAWGCSVVGCRCGAGACGQY